MKMLGPLATAPNRTAVDAERPWIGVQFAVEIWDLTNLLALRVFYYNSGREAAKVTLVALTP